MKPHKNKIFVKTFTYTVVSMLLLVIITAALFYGQFTSFYRAAQTRQIIASYEPLVERIRSGAETETSGIARLFYENNQSFEFYVADRNGNVQFATPNADTDDVFDGDFYFVVHRDADFSIVAQSRTGLEAFYGGLVARALFAFFAMVALCAVGAYFFARKVTEPIIARLEDEVKHERELEKAQRFFFSAASHELKTPIAAMSVLLEGMLENIGEYKDHAKYLRECLKLSDAQGALVSEILEIVNLIDGKITPIIERVSLREALAEVLSACQTLADAAGQRVNVDISENAAVLADSSMLKRVLSNVILNAVQNAPHGAEIRVWSAQNAERMRLSVLNTDTRIDEDVLPKLFDPFYRADKARGRKNGRSGLGLTIAQKTLDAMGADFVLENTVDGVLFWIDFQNA